jgi:hypothetical protein
LAVWLIWPVLSDDAVRYRFEGGTWLVGESPYAVPPGTRLRQAVSGRPTDSIDRLVPHPELASIYPPVAQAQFVLCRWLENQTFGPAPEFDGRNWRTAAGDMPWKHRLGVQKVFSSAAWMGCIGVLLRLGRRLGVCPGVVGSLGVHPLAVVEFSGNAHIDSLAVLLLAIGLCRWAKQGHWGTWLALSIATKPFGLLVAPFLARGDEKWRSNLVGLVIAGGALSLPIVAFPGGLDGLTATARTYAASWEANGSVYELLKRSAGADQVLQQARKDLGRQLHLVGVLGITAILVYVSRNPLAGASWALLISLLLSPVVYPWHVAACAIVAVLARDGPVVACLMLAGTVCMAHNLWNSGDWQLPWQILAAEYAPVYAIAAVEALTALQRISSRSGSRS